MRIGSDQNFLQIEGLDQAAPFSLVQIEAQTACPGWMSSVFNQQLEVNDPESVGRWVSDFRCGTTRRLEITFSGAGWLRARRYTGGQIVVHYRFSHLTVGAAVEGELVLSPPSAEEVCSALEALFAEPEPAGGDNRAPADPEKP
jgi:hypothetical protein